MKNVCKRLACQFLGVDQESSIPTGRSSILEQTSSPRQDHSGTKDPRDPDLLMSLQGQNELIKPADRLVELTWGLPPK